MNVHHLAIDSDSMHVALAFEPTLNIIVGANGTGKTLALNILAAAAGQGSVKFAEDTSLHIRFSGVPSSNKRLKGKLNKDVYNLSASAGKEYHDLAKLDDFPVKGAYLSPSLNAKGNKNIPLFNIHSRKGVTDIINKIFDKALQTDKLLTKINEKLAFLELPLLLNYEKETLNFVGGAKLHNLPSGVRNLILIVLTFESLSEKDSIILLDEPEISMHPNMQLNFMNFIQKYYSKFRIIIATHSHLMLLGASADAVQGIGSFTDYSDMYTSSEVLLRTFSVNELEPEELRSLKALADKVNRGTATEEEAEEFLQLRSNVTEGTEADRVLEWVLHLNNME